MVYHYLLDKSVYCCAIPAAIASKTGVSKYQKSTHFVPTDYCIVAAQEGTRSDYSKIAYMVVAKLFTHMHCA